MKPINGGSSSLAVDYKKIDTLYHGTSVEQAQKIRAEGIKPVRGFSHVTTSQGIAERYAEGAHHGEGHERGAVLHIDRNHPSLKGLKVDPDSPQEREHPDAFRTKNHIPPEAIKGYHEFDN